MAYVLHSYGPAVFWNLAAESDLSFGPIPLDELSGAHFRGQYSDHGVLVTYSGEGSFQPQEGVAQVQALRGTLTEDRVYVNNSLLQSEQYSPGIDVSRMSEYGYVVNTILAGDDAFYCSLDPSQIDSDGIRGGAGNDLFFGGGDVVSGVGGDWFYGEGGIDTAVYRGDRSEYTLTKGMAYDYILDDGTTLVEGFRVQDHVQGRDGRDTLVTTERLQFADTKVALDLAPGQHAGQTMAFIGAVAPALLNDTAVRGVILSLFDQGQSMASLAQQALDLNLLPASSSAALVNAVYQNVIGSAASQAMTDELVGYVEELGQAGFLATVAGLCLNVDLVGLQLTAIEYTL